MIDLTLLLVILMTGVLCGSAGYGLGYVMGREDTHEELTPERPSRGPQIR